MLGPRANEFMKQFRQFAAVAAFLVSVAMNTAAQSGTNDTISPTPTAIKRTTDGRILQPDTVLSPASAGVIATRPDRNERALPPEIKERLRQFEAAREAFIKRQEELRRRMEGATTDRERESIRQRQKESLERWREQARQFKDEAKERARELQREMPNLREALEESPRGTPGKPGRPGVD